MCAASTSRLLQLLEEVRRLEVLGHGVVEPRDHLVDGLLPALFRVLAALDGAVKLSQSLFNHISEV